MRTKNKQTTGFDKGLLFLTLLLTFLGILAVADASAPQALSVFSDPLYFAKQQMMWALIGIFAMIVAILIPFRTWEKISIIVFVLGLVLLVAVLIPGIGVRVLGARRWINLGAFSFQPSESVKLSLAMFLAFLISRDRPLWQSLGAIGLTAGLVMLQPDLGTTIVIVVIGFTQLFVSGVSLFKLAAIGVSGIALAMLAILGSPYRRQRLLTFFESSTDPLGTSYHIRQILIAIGSGGIFGVGIGQSRQKYLFLPETATDSVFAVISEEVGFVGSSILILMLMAFTLKAFKIAKRAPDKFSQVLACGIASWIASQMFVNLASMVALTPLTGIPLPFFSYGGTSLVMLLFSVGILLNISRKSA